MHINSDRLAQTFTTLCEMDSPSRSEKSLAQHLCQTFEKLGADAICEDNSAPATGSNTGNILIRFNGYGFHDHGIFLACHMDTVEPGCGIKVVRDKNILKSSGDTILGADDKSGIAAIIELITILREHKIHHTPIELIFTTCEEIGLLGAKNLEHEFIHARHGFALDSSGVNRVIIGAPAANRLQIDIHGSAAHAGLNPEQGISAFSIAARAIDQLKLGRLDEESSANLGTINGGKATNIIPDYVTIKGEVRSHSQNNLEIYTRNIENTFIDVAKNWPLPKDFGGRQPYAKIERWLEYPEMSLSMDSPVIQRIQQAGNQLGKELKFLASGGGSDANILNNYGLSTAIIATGMNKVHTTEEYLDLNHLIRLTELILALVTLPASQNPEDEKSSILTQNIR